jgi:hypothetical protein
VRILTLNYDCYHWKYRHRFQNDSATILKVRAGYRTEIAPSTFDLPTFRRTGSRHFWGLKLIARIRLVLPTAPSSHLWESICKILTYLNIIMWSRWLTLLHILRDSMCAVKIATFRKQLPRQNKRSEKKACDCNMIISKKTPPSIYNRKNPIGYCLVNVSSKIVFNCWFKPGSKLNALKISVLHLADIYCGLQCMF